MNVGTVCCADASFEIWIHFEIISYAYWDDIVAGLLDNLGIKLQDCIENIVEDATDSFAAVLKSILCDTIGGM